MANDYNYTIEFSTTEFVYSTSDQDDLLKTYFFFCNLTCDKVTVYNPTFDIRQTDNPSSIIIWRTGDPVPTTPYIIFNELVVALRNTYYNGVLTFSLSARNELGTIRTKTSSVEVDLRTTPLWTTPNFQYSGGYTINGHLYYLPDVRGITLSWNAATERLENGTVSYDVEYKLSTSNDWTRAGWGITNTSIVISPPSGDTQRTYNVRVVAKVSYDRSTSNNVQNILIDKYLRPILGLSSKKRNATSVVVNLNITPRTTILSSDYSIASLSFLKCDGSTYVSLPTTSWTPSFEYGVSPYEDATFTKTTSYTMVCRFNDSLGAVFGGSYENVLTLSIPITAYTPMFSIRKKGIGINDINDGTGGYIAKIKGKVNSVTDDSSESGYYVNGVNVLLLLHPVGCLYWSSNATSPATLFGGTWTQIKDTFILAAGDTYALGTTGGEANVALSALQIPWYFAYVAYDRLTPGTSIKFATNANGDATLNTWNNRAVDSHNNMPPYKVCYCWERTA